MGDLNYLVTVSRPDLAWYVNFIARNVSKPTIELRKLGTRIISFAFNTRKEARIEYLPWKQDEKKPVIRVFSDSSFADRPEEGYRSTAGILIYLNSSLVGWKSSKLKQVATSTCVAEYLALHAAVIEAI